MTLLASEEQVCFFISGKFCSEERRSNNITLFFFFLREDISLAFV